MYRRLLPALVLTVALPLSASALSTTNEMRVGSFEATGTGTLVARGSLTAFGRIDGSIVVLDRVGGALVKLNGIPQHSRQVRVGRRIVRVFLIRKAKGPFYVRGREVRIELRAPIAPVSVAIIGRGTVPRLDGDGTYTLNAEPTAAWVDAPLPLHIKPPQKVAPAPPATTADTAPAGEGR